MRQKLTTPLLLTALVVCGASSSAATETEEITRLLAERLPGVTVDSVGPSPIDGILEVRIDGTDVVYVTDDGRYLVSGVIVDLITRENLTERVRAEQRLSALRAISERKMIVFEPTGAVKHTVTTFTDIDCPYCRKMHSEMAILNRMGIRVRYLLFPRAGVNSESYEKAVSVWCAEDQQNEMTDAKGGIVPDKRNCDNPIREHMTLAYRLGLRGTPFTITDTGRAINGYMPAPELLETLDADRRRLAR